MEGIIFFLMYFLLNASSKPLDIATSNFSQVLRSTDKEGAGQHFVGSRSNNVLSCKCISNLKFCRCIGHMIWRVLDNILYDLIMYFLVNASP